MGDLKTKWEKALTERNCEELLELFDDYFEEIEEDKLEEELEKLVKVSLECENPYELLHEIAHIYLHLGEKEKAIDPYRKLVELKEGDPEEYATALYYLADAYEHFGMPKEAIETYEKLLKLENEVLKNEKEVALTLANIAMNYDELGATERAIELLERARETFKRIGDKKNWLISTLDLGHFHYELGNYDTAEALINEVLRNPHDDEIEVNAKLVKAEIQAGKEDYEGAFKALREALLKANEISDDVFELVFETLLDFIEGLFNEGAYKTIARNVESFANLFEDDTKHFFLALGELARWKDGEGNAKKRFEELYKKVKNEELRSILDEWKRPKLSLGLSF